MLFFRARRSRRQLPVVLLLMIVAVPHLAYGFDETQDSPTEVANRVDLILEDAMQHANVQPYPLAADTTFVRRVYLDLVGRIPTPVETRNFINDRKSNKRQALIEKLANSASYARHAAVFWRRTWVPQADTQQFESLADELDHWIEASINSDMPYDQLVKQLLTATSDAMSTEPNEQRDGSAPVAFLRASNFQAETLAANSARAFLGLDLDCAECHDHPFSRWTRDEFWQFAAFFAAVKKEPDNEPPRIKIADTDRFVTAQLFTGEPVEWPKTLRPDEGRLVLAEWLTAKDNPYLARNAVNRMWALYLGTGLIEPLDDISDTNPPSHPEVLNLLTDTFVQSGYDLRYLSRCIVNTRAYQRSSTSTETSPSTEPAGAPHLFARMPVRALSGEQLHDSLRTAVGLSLERADLPDREQLAERRSLAKRFLTDRPAEAERSIPQALMMMNGPRIDRATQMSRSRLIQAVLTAPYLTHQERVDMLFLSTLNRFPTAKECELLFETAHTHTHEDYEDAMWALLNSVEFNTNH